MVILVSILIMESFVINEPILDMVGADPPPDPPSSNRFGNWAEPKIFNVTVTETDNIITVNTSNNFSWNFYKDTFGYNEIYHNGSILIQNEQWWLEYQKNPSTWKPRGTPYNVTYEQPEPHHVIVTRKYTDYISTDFNVTFDFYSNNRVKISLIGNVGQTDTYRIRWDASGINTEHMEHDSSSNRTKIWNGAEGGMVFDYEDVYMSFGNITTVETEQQANNHKLHHYFNVGELGIGGFELDPTFGYTDTGYSMLICGGGTERLRGAWDTMGVADGTADSISVKFATIGDTASYQCAIYEYVDYSSSYAGVLVDVTETKEVLGTDDNELITFNFDAPKPSLTASTKYYLCIRITIECGFNNYIDGKSEAGYGIYDSYFSPLTFDSPLTGEASTSSKPYIYCSYSVGAANTAPTQSSQKIWNATTKVEKSLNATGVSLTPTCFNVTIADTDSDHMNVTIKTNESGTWTTVNATTSGMTDGIYHGYNTSWIDTYSTKYWVSFNVSDDSEWCNETYKFTTSDFIWIDITNATWDLGNIVMSSSIWTNETSKTFIADKDNCSVATDLKLQITNDGADWTAATAGNAAGADTYRLNSSINTWGAENQIVTASTTTISSGIVAGNNETFDLRFDTPTSTTVSTEQSVTVTATIAKS